MPKKIKTRKVVEECLSAGITSPSLIKAELEKRYGKKISDNAITMMIKRLGVDRSAIEQKIKLERSKDIMETQRVKDYITVADSSGVTAKQKNMQLKKIQKVWEWMGKSSPDTWNYTELINILKQVYPAAVDERGRTVFEKPAAVADYLSAVSTIFPNVMPEGWSAGFTRKAGELKDYLTFLEFDSFINALTDTAHMNIEGWRVCYKEQVNLGAREGSLMHTGILSLLWENIDYEKRRCSLREKGGKGDAARTWTNLPLDLFPWLHGFDDLIAYHKQLFGYEPTNERHATGRVFPVAYNEYRKQFHNTRKRCNGRIAGDKETLVPHVIRKTHAQWLVKLRVPLERICGQFPDGRYGVGWDNPTILLKYYITLESDEETEINEKAQKRMQALGLLPSPVSLSVEPSTISEMPIIQN